jgi:hypothetical protein
MTDFSPAAQAVLDAVEDHSRFSYSQLAAAALRAAADQVVPGEPENRDLDLWNRDDISEWYQWSERMHTRSRLLAIAAELEALA